MKKSFIHCADLHLGFNQFNLEERFDDFDRSFGAIVDAACLNKVDYFFISGDIFNKRNINAATLDVAIKHFESLSAAGIRTLAIEGNHDQAHFHDKFSWMQYLSKNDHITLLKPVFQEGTLQLSSTQKGEPGLHYEDDHLRIFGLGYLGNTLGEKIRELASQIQPTDKFTILMAHGGIGGIEIGRLSLDDLRPFYHLFDYIALGHQHSHHEYEDRVYIPGAPEYYDLGEAGKQKGYFLVDFQGKTKNVSFFESSKRATINIRHDIGAQTWQETSQIITNLALKKTYGFNSPLLRVELLGQVSLNITAQDVDQLRKSLAEVTRALYVEVLDNTGSEQLAIKYDITDNSIASIERAIITEELAKDPRYFDIAMGLADFVLHFKQQVLDDPAKGLEELKNADVEYLFTPQANLAVKTEQVKPSELMDSPLLTSQFYQAALF